MDTIWIFMMVLLILAFLWDMRTSRIPNWLTASGCISGLLIAFYNEGWHGAIPAILGLLAGFIPLFVLYLAGALGAGDVKLFAAIGALGGASFAMESAVYSVLIAGLIGFGILLCRKMMIMKLFQLVSDTYGLIRWGDYSFLRPESQRSMLKFPFMYAVFPGVLLAGYDKIF